MGPSDRRPPGSDPGRLGSFINAGRRIPADPGFELGVQQPPAHEPSLVPDAPAPLGAAALQGADGEAAGRVRGAGGVEAADAGPGGGVGTGVLGHGEGCDEDVVRRAWWMPAVEVADQALEEQGL